MKKQWIGVVSIHLDIYLQPKSQKQLILPIHYNYLIQSAIYHSIDDKLAKFLHEQGYTTNNRKFKMFSFSILQGNYRMEKEYKTIRFEGEVKLTVTSPVEDFCQTLVNILLTRGSIRLGSKDVEVIKVYTRKELVEKENIKLRTLSPIVLYSTMFRLDGRKYTVYFEPGDPDYVRLLNDNLKKKYKAFWGMEPPAEDIKVISLGWQKMRIINYKGTTIKGYSGKLKLMGPVPLLQLAVDGGLGGKNSQGFGCVELVKG